MKSGRAGRPSPGPGSNGKSRRKRGDEPSHPLTPRPCPSMGPRMSATAPKPPLRVVLCAPRGFCAGVVRAVDIVERTLQMYGAPVYVRHEIVHNKFVVD